MQRRTLSIVLVANCLLLGRAFAQQGGGLGELEVLAPTRSAPTATTLPVSAFVARPEMREIALSPNGRHAAGAMRDPQGNYALAIFDLEQPSARPLIVSTEGSGHLDRIRWVDDARLLFRVYSVRVVTGPGSTAAFPNLQMYAVNADGSNLQPVDLSTREGYGVGVELDVVHALPNDAERVLLAYRELGSREQALFNANIETGVHLKDAGRAYAVDAPGSSATYDVKGASALVVSTPSAIDHWYLDGAGEPRLGRGVASTLESFYYRAPDNDNWVTIASHRVDAGVVFEPLIFDATDPDVFYVISNHEAGVLGLYRYRGSEQRFMERPLAMTSAPQFIDVTYDALHSRIEALRYGPGDDQVLWLDTNLEHALKQAQTKLPGWRIDVATASADNTRLLLYAQGSDRPGRYYLYEPASGAIRYFARTYPELNPPLSLTRSVTFDARDGAAINAYLNLPVGMSRPPAAPLPTVIMPHGEAEARDFSAFDPLVQLLANRGYAVLQLDYERTLRYAPAPYATWQRQPHDDVADAADWLVAEHIADSAKICVLGTGAGGYAALLTAVENPDRYACVVSHDGFSDLRTMKAYYTLLFNTDASVAMLGDAPDAELDMHSPMRRAAELKVPVLLAHSKEAPIPAQQSEAMDRALRRVRIEHEFLELDNDSRDAELKYLTALDTFLGKHLH